MLYCGRYLLTVSKDRSFCVYERAANGMYGLLATVKAHRRIIWSGSWASDSTCFVTGTVHPVAALQCLSFPLFLCRKRWILPPVFDLHPLCCDALGPGSRDQTVKFWGIHHGPSSDPPTTSDVVQISTLPSFAAAVTAVAVLPSTAPSAVHVAVGMESGAVEVWRCVPVPGAGWCCVPWLGLALACVGVGLYGFLSGSWLCCS